MFKLFPFEKFFFYDKPNQSVRKNCPKSRRKGKLSKAEGTAHLSHLDYVLRYYKIGNKEKIAFKQGLFSRRQHFLPPRSPRTFPLTIFPSIQAPKT